MEAFLDRAAAEDRAVQRRLARGEFWDGDQWRPQYTDVERAERIAATAAAFERLERWYAAGRPAGGPNGDDPTIGGPDDAA